MLYSFLANLSDVSSLLRNRLWALVLTDCLFCLSQIYIRASVLTLLCHLCQHSSFPLSEHVIPSFGTTYTQGEKGYAPSSLSLWLALYRVLSTGVRELLSELKRPEDPPVRST